MIEIEAKRLKAALRGIMQVVERRNTIPILSNVLLVASTRALVLTGTDLDIQIERRLVADGKSAFTTTVGAALLSDIVAKLPAEGMVKLAVKEDRLVVSCGRSLFKLSMLPADDWPVMRPGEDAVSFSLAAPQLALLFDTTRFAVCTDATRYYLNGVFLHPASDRLKAAATDGHRLANVSIALPEGADAMPAAIVPRKTVDLILGLSDGVPDVIDVALSASKICLTIGEDTIVSKLIDGTFPDYSRVIPTGNERRLAIDPAVFAQAVERVATIASEKTRAVSLTLDKDVVRLVVSSPENGVANEDVPADHSDNGVLTIGFNGRYLLDVLRQLPHDTVEVMFGDAAAPTLFRRDADADALFVLMPMRV